MPRRLHAICCAIMLAAGCAPAKHQPAPRRMLYAIPDSLPENYGWTIDGVEATDIVWVGARLSAAGELRNIPEILIAESPPKARHHLLVGLTTVKAGNAVLTQAAARRQSIALIRQLLAARKEISGIQLDFEYLPPELAGAFVFFTAELRKAIYPTVVYTAVFPPVGMPEKWSAFHTIPELAEVADGLVVMLYDQHRPGTEPGCVTGLDWLDANVRTLAPLPRKKIWLGAPLYGYRFIGEKTAAISRKYFEKISANEENQNGCRVKKHGNAMSYYPSGELNSHLRIIEQQFTFAGIAYWRAGLE